MDFNKLGVNLATVTANISKDHNLADAFQQRLVSMINEFNLSIDKDSEVGLQLCNFGQKITFYITNIGYWNPSLIHFYGIDTETHNEVELIQHVSQINVLLIKLPKLKPEEPKRPIGFSTWEEFEESKDR